MNPYVHYSTIFGDWYVAGVSDKLLDGPFATEAEAHAFIDNPAGERIAEDLNRATARLIDLMGYSVKT